MIIIKILILLIVYCIAGLGILYGITHYPDIKKWFRNRCNKFKKVVDDIIENENYWKENNL